MITFTGNPDDESGYARKCTDAVFAWLGMEFLSPEWNNAYKALWMEFPKEMKHGWNLMDIKFVEKPENYFDEFVALVAKEKRDKEDRAKLRTSRFARNPEPFASSMLGSNCGTQECNGETMCEDHYRQFVGL